MLSPWQTSAWFPAATGMSPEAGPTEMMPSASTILATGWAHRPCASTGVGPQSAYRIATQKNALRTKFKREPGAARMRLLRATEQTGATTNVGFATDLDKAPPQTSL